MSLCRASPRLASLLLLMLALHGALALRLCSFNVRSFGESKKGNHEAMDIIVKVSSCPGHPSSLLPAVDSRNLKLP